MKKLYVISKDPCVINTLNSHSETFQKEMIVPIQVAPISSVIAIDKQHAIAVFLDLESCPIPITITTLTAAFPKIPILCLSSDYKQAFQAFKKGVTDVFIKPMAPNAFHKAILRYSNQKKNTNHLIQMGTDTDCYYLQSKDILYLKADDHSVDVFLTDERTITIFNTLAYFEQTLLPPFFRIQRSYLVNAMHVQRIQHTKKLIYLHDKTHPLPFSKTYSNQLEQLVQWLNRCCF